MRMWVWNVPFFFPQPNGNDLAVLLIDTQGMFDHETTMAVTESIFGLSSLISSYQIFNVDKSIQEDHLQKLALFSEYGRLAIKEETKQHEIKEKDVNKLFQQIEFLVRDWKNFDCDGEGELSELEQEMDEYLASCIEERSGKDFQDTREQITSCFESIKFFLLTHPGHSCPEKVLSKRSWKSLLSFGKEMRFLLRDAEEKTLPDLFQIILSSMDRKSQIESILKSKQEFENRWSNVMELGVGLEKYRKEGSCMNAHKKACS